MPPPPLPPQSSPTGGSTSTPSKSKEKQGQWCRSLVACGHLFHRKCLDGWLIKVAACPICRTRVRFENDDNCNSGPCSRRAEFQGLFDLGHFTLLKY
ncbi:hypothetical protein GOBAR_AA34312 [Gossypium barbadense]|uniref:RING-type E3 ubiquitin transferase n=1 Tax=Gossypium barbadense TaxID=3634 RepID=A0A2P5W5N5_GOSBA|nr:hypothetical protein GOBAR_AA34312 [Gossypium barbadense]